MSEKITVPSLGESVTEATVSKWLKSQGDKVIADEPVVELETDKVNVEVPAPINGFLGSIAVKEGETVNVGSLLGTISNNTKQENTPKEIKTYSPPKKDKSKNNGRERRWISYRFKYCKKSTYRYNHVRTSSIMYWRCLANRKERCDYS